jgi:hypothetical protein
MAFGKKFVLKFYGDKYDFDYDGGGDCFTTVEYFESFDTMEEVLKSLGKVRYEETRSEIKFDTVKEYLDTLEIELYERKVL